MNIKEQKAQAELNHYFECARKHKCPPSMKQDLYKQLELDNSHNWWSPRIAVAGLTLAFVSALVINISNKNTQQLQIDQAQAELQVAMHYINRVTFKPLNAVTNKGLKPGLIMPLSRSVASL